MNRFLFVCILMIMATTKTFCQTGSISGKMVHSDMQPVVGATVVLKFESVSYKYAITDDNGYYEIKDIAYGNHTLEISSLNIEKETVKIEHKKKQTVLNYKVKSKVYLLDNMIVSHETEISKKKKQGFSVNIIETKDVSLRNVQTNELLNSTVGVRVRQNGGLGAENRYSLNGLSGNSIRIFINGIPISTFGSSFNLNSIPPSIIERIEVYKGVVPGHLSDDSLGGAINIILKEGTRNNFNASVSYGSFNTFQTNFSGQYRFKKSGFTVKSSAFYNYSDNDYEVWGKNVYNIQPNGQYQYVRAKRFNDVFRSIGGKIEVGYTKVKWADNFFIGFTGSDAYKEVQHGTFMTTPYKGRFLESDAKLFSLTYNKKDFVKNVDLDFNGFAGVRNRIINDTVKWNYNWYGEQSLDLNGNPILTPDGAQQSAPTLANIKRNVASFRLGLTLHLHQNHRILFNHMFSIVDREDDDEMKSVLERKFLGTRNLKKSITSLSYDFEAFDKKLRGSLFGKNYNQEIERIDPVVDTQDGNSTIVDDIVASKINTLGYGFALSYAILPKLSLLTSAEKAVRLPTENEVFGDSGDNISENPNIKPEESSNYNLGFNIGQIEYKKHALGISVNGFIRDIQNRIGVPVQTSLNSNVQTLPFVNQGNVKSKGFEIELNYTFNSNLSIRANTSKYNLTTSVGGIEYQLPNEPFLNANLSAQYSFKNVIQKESNLSLFFNFLYVDEFNYLRPLYSNNAGTDFFKIPKQYITDFGINYTFPNKRVIASFDAKNIFNNQAFDNMAVQKPGRAFYLKLNYILNNF